MISFDAAHKTVHYPQDRRFRIWVRPSILIGIAAAIALLLFAAWIEFGLVGLPYVSLVHWVATNPSAGLAPTPRGHGSAVHASVPAISRLRMPPAGMSVRSATVAALTGLRRPRH
jgi:hypothetical protein